MIGHTVTIREGTGSEVLALAERQVAHRVLPEDGRMNVIRFGR